MLEDIPPDLPPVAAIEPYIEELSTSRELPSFAVSLCTMRYPDSGPLLRAALARAADGTLADRDDERLFFRGLFIVGGRRDPMGFEPLLRFLQRPQDEVEHLLGDVITEDLARITAGVYDGNADALFEAIIDLRLGEFVRVALFGAATFLTWDGRIERDRTASFLRRFDSERLAPDGDAAWYAWLQAIALLGLREMEPTVMAAWDRGSIPEYMLERKHFADDLARTERAPDDIGRFKDAYLGYIDDALESLERWPLTGDEDDVFAASKLGDDLPVGNDERLPLTLPGQPAVNPWRHVGRNDPCPCGSGKKFKRCCLPT
jgi:hypothetical protein